MNEFQPHYDANGVFRYVTLHHTDYAPGHPIADLWLERARLHEALTKITDTEDLVQPWSFATNILEGMSFQDAIAAERTLQAAWEARTGL